MKTFAALLAASLLMLSSGNAQESKVVEAAFKVSGNCNICKARIEKALKIKEVKFARWDPKSKLATVAYLSPAVSLDSLQHRVAAVGHDTEKFKAPDAVYQDLPECCLYRKATQ
jgi:copper chaperone CopZ